MSEFFTKDTERGRYTIVFDGVFHCWIPEHAVDTNRHTPSDQICKPLPWDVNVYDAGPRPKKVIQQFDTHYGEVYARLHNEKWRSGDIVEQLHDGTGAMEREWKARGGHYGHERDEKYNSVRSGPRIRTNEEAREYARVSREVLGKRGFVLR